MKMLVTFLLFITALSAMAKCEYHLRPKSILLKKSEDFFGRDQLNIRVRINNPKKFSYWLYDEGDITIDNLHLRAGEEQRIRAVEVKIAEGGWSPEGFIKVPRHTSLNISIKEFDSIWGGGSDKVMVQVFPSNDLSHLLYEKAKHYKGEVARMDKENGKVRLTFEVLRTCEQSLR